MNRLVATGLVAIVVLAAASLSEACGASSSEGSVCSTSDDCDADLACQEIPGRGCQTYCCPTPSDTSGQTNCQDKLVDGEIPPYPTTCGTSTSTATDAAAATTKD